MLDYRNLLSHTYNPAVFEQEVAAIHQRYLPAPAQAPSSRITTRQFSQFIDAQHNHLPRADGGACGHP